MRKKCLQFRPFFLAATLIVFGAACHGEDHAQVPAMQTQELAEPHEHGADTHTHDTALAADTAGTYVDSTGQFFDAEPAEHEHGPETHTHDDDDAHEHENEDAPGHNE